MDNIPHIIHYCWFGKNPKPQLVIDCISTWERYFPGWEIKEWNEDNYNVRTIPYIQEAYEAKKWVFVADYARFDILYQYGGIYLDTDVEFIKPLPQQFLQLKGFTGFECTGIVAPGLIFAVEKNFPILKEFINQYKTEHFEIKADGIYKTVNLHVTEILQKEGLKTDNTLQTVAGLTVFPSEYFCGYDTDIHEPDITCNTICWHHYFASWSKVPFKSKVQNVLKKAIGKKNYKKLILLKRRLNK